MTKWFALSFEGQVHYLGEFPSIEEADESLVGFGAVWIFDTDTARDFVTEMNKHLEG
jgi:hypothetical protein